MRNIKVIMSYRGTAYHGFQRQINAVGIQNVTEDTLSHILADKTVITGCSRTDTGVHANEFCFSFKTENRIPCDKLIRGMNALLPEDIALQHAEDVSEDFHARYSCKGKEYVYLILNRETRDPFYSDTAFHYPYEMDFDKMKRAAEQYVGTHDFTSFCGSDNQKENSVRTIEYFNIIKDESFVKFVVKGDGFLYNMVRIMAGTLLCVNEGKISPDDIEGIILAKNRCLAGRTAKAHGLYLNRVFYD